MDEECGGGDWLERDEFINIGELPGVAVSVLWPGVAVDDTSVWLNPVHLRRHLQSRDAYLERIAFLNREGPHLLESFGRVVACIRYDKVPVGQHGMMVVCRLVQAREHEDLVVVGVRFIPAAMRGRRLFVSTVYPWSEGKLLRALRRSPHWLNPLDKRGRM